MRVNALQWFYARVGAFKGAIKAINFSTTLGGVMSNKIEKYLVIGDKWIYYNEQMWPCFYEQLSKAKYEHLKPLFENRNPYTKDGVIE